MRFCSQSERPRRDSSKGSADVSSMTGTFTSSQISLLLSLGTWRSVSTLRGHSGRCPAEIEWLCRCDASEFMMAQMSRERVMMARVDNRASNRLVRAMLICVSAAGRQASSAVPLPKEPTDLVCLRDRQRATSYKSRACASGAGFFNNANAATLTPSRLRLDDDFHVLPEPGQEAHQTFAREARKPAIRTV